MNDEKTNPPPASAATAERELLIEAVANALCCEHMGALPGAYSLTHEKDCAKGSESAYMWKSARVAVEAMTAHCAAATAKERQARQALQTQLDETIASAAESMKRPRQTVKLSTTLKGIACCAVVIFVLWSIGTAVIAIAHSYK
jgi:hypothetical protein